MVCRIASGLESEADRFGRVRERTADRREAHVVSDNGRHVLSRDPEHVTAGEFANEDRATAYVADIPDGDIVRIDHTHRRAHASQLAVYFQTRLRGLEFPATSQRGRGPPDGT